MLTHCSGRHPFTGHLLKEKPVNPFTGNEAAEGETTLDQSSFQLQWEALPRWQALAAGAHSPNSPIQRLPLSIFQIIINCGIPVRRVRAFSVLLHTLSRTRDILFALLPSLCYSALTACFIQGWSEQRASNLEVLSGKLRSGIS